MPIPTSLDASLVRIGKVHAQGLGAICGTRPFLSQATPTVTTLIRTSAESPNFVWQAPEEPVPVSGSWPLRTWQILQSRVQASTGFRVKMSVLGRGFRT